MSQPANAAVPRLQGIISPSQLFKLGEGDWVPMLSTFDDIRPHCPIPNRLLPLTARLGLPIFYSTPIQLQFAQLPAEFLPPFVKEVPDNAILATLGAKKAPHEPSYFAVPILPGYPQPVLMLCRADGENLERGHVTALWSFVEGVMEQAGKEKTSMAAYAKFDGLMTVEKFVAFYEEFRGKYKGSPDKRETMGWEHLECPVKLGCKACGKDEGKLLRCGKCGVVKYCDRDCQKGDWTNHKKVCVKG